MNKLLMCLFSVVTLCCSVAHADEVAGKKRCPCGDACVCQECQCCPCACCLSECDCQGTGSCGMPAKAA